MIPRDAPVAAPADLDMELDGYVAAFEAAYHRDPDADLGDFLPPADHPLVLEVLCELVRVDLEFAWDRGDERRVDYYRFRFPQLFKTPALLRAVVQEEVRLRIAAGEQPDADEFERRFGSGVESLGATRVVPALTNSDRPPEPGDLVAGFRVVAQLGCGAFGRVYLCHQTDLADRFVAVKVSTKFPGESQTLARLQHANIVPVYSVHRHGRYHVVCMPYLGATTLADLLHEFHKAGRLPASGHQVASTLNDRASRTATLSDTPEPTPAPTPSAVISTPPAILARYDESSYVELVLWLGAELADGLAHAHDRGILHRDIKPANVLLTDEGRPMLLDFNLSSDVIETDAYRAFVGGTIRYMAPEQLTAMVERAGTSDARADVYSLGLVLYELLTDHLPHTMPSGSPDDVVPLLRDVRRTEPTNPRQYRGDVTPAVASILRMALAPDPAARYQSAANLRDDLLRQLNHEPLKFAPDRSVSERFRKWAKRHPRLSSWVTVTALAVLVIVALTAAALARQRHYERVEAVNGLHHVTDTRHHVRALLADRSVPGAALDEADSLCREAIGRVPSFADQRLSPEELHELRQRLAELNYFQARVAAIRSERTVDPHEKRRYLEVAVQANGAAWDRVPNGKPSPELIGQRAWLWRQTGREAEARELAAQVGVTDESNPRAAARRVLPALAAAVATESGRWEYWLHRGRLELVAGEVAAARGHFQTAADLAPESPWPHYDAGVAALLAKDFPAAKTAFDRCLALRAELPEAYLNRAIAHIELKDYPAAIRDLDRIEPHAAQLPRLYFIREVAKRRGGDAKGADHDRGLGLALTPTDAAGWNARGDARLSLTPPDVAGAVADFEKAIELDPDLPQGYQNLANALSESLNRPADAIKVLDRAVERFPEYTPARAGRGVLLARLGQREAARRDADATVARDPSAIVCYQAGCVYLLTGDREKGLALLRRALRLDPVWAKDMPADPDLKLIHNAVEFRRLMGAAAELTR